MIRLTKIVNYFLNEFLLILFTLRKIFLSSRFTFSCAPRFDFFIFPKFNFLSILAEFLFTLTNERLCDSNSSLSQEFGFLGLFLNSFELLASLNRLS